MPMFEADQDAVNQLLSQRAATQSRLYKHLSEASDAFATFNASFVSPDKKILESQIGILQREMVNGTDKIEEISNALQRLLVKAKEDEGGRP